MKVKPAQHGRRKGVSAGTGTALKVTSAGVKKRGGSNTRPLNCYIAYRSK